VILLPVWDSPAFLLSTLRITAYNVIVLLFDDFGDWATPGESTAGLFFARTFFRAFELRHPAGKALPQCFQKEWPTASIVS
jgi:hypothetical protein